MRRLKPSHSVEPGVITLIAGSVISEEVLHSILNIDLIKHVGAGRIVCLAKVRSTLDVALQLCEKS